MGRDYFVRVIYGTRVSLAVGLFASIIVLIIGVLYGSISGYFGGKVDLIMMRIVDIIYSLPDMLMVILLSVVLRETLNVDAIPFLQKLGPNMISMFIVFGLLYWTGMARMVRGQILTIKQNEYVLAAKISGAKSGRIIRRHIPVSYTHLDVYKRQMEALAEVVSHIGEYPEGRERAVYCREKVVTAMEELRRPVDELEMLVDKEMWPMPSYGDLIFEV